MVVRTTASKKEITKFVPTLGFIFNLVVTGFGADQFAVSYELLSVNQNQWSYLACECVRVSKGHDPNST